MRSRPKPPSRRKPAKCKSAESRLPEDFVVAAAHILGLTIKRDWLPAVRLNLKTILEHAALLDELPLPDDAEPAPVFRV